MARFPVSQATVSHHLKVLTEAGLVAVRQDGPYHRYTAIEATLAAHARELRSIAGSGRGRARGGRP